MNKEPEITADQQVEMAARHASIMAVAKEPELMERARLIRELVATQTNGKELTLDDFEAIVLNAILAPAEMAVRHVQENEATLIQIIKDSHAAMDGVLNKPVDYARFAGKKKLREMMAAIDASGVLEA